jgi:hypothetical protein
MGLADANTTWDRRSKSNFIKKTHPLCPDAQREFGASELYRRAGTEYTKCGAYTSHGLQVSICFAYKIQQGTTLHKISIHVFCPDL